MADVTRGTPKRKRKVQTPLTPVQLSFEIANEEAVEDGSRSPRSSVAHRFGGLELGGGYLTPQQQESDRVKRQRSDDHQDIGIISDIPEKRNLFPAKTSSPLPAAAAPRVSQERGQAKAVTTPKQKSKKRSGTPPLRLKRSPIRDQDNKDDDDDERSNLVIADPVRASLTWHEDEITIYDPDDEDDDGIGINGVGFKPTPALARVRAMKRQQQMAEYRKREESEARAWRSQRRRDGFRAERHEGKLAARRVRFLEAERQKLALMTGSHS